MTKLDRIVMQGFKSFASKVVLPLPGGFTAVAGPNGSGKSNIVDAVTFVLGTTSARHIRAHKLQNLIFNGAASRKPAEYCEVSLAFDNSDGRIPGGEKEMTITRRITRSGISVYKING
jgi:chromosome segregation protein